MNFILKIINGIRLTIILFIIISILQSCKGYEVNPKAIELNNKAVQLMQRRDYDKALVLFNKAIEIDENYHILYSNMTTLYLNKKQYDKALQASNKVIEIKPDLAEAWTFAGMLYDRMGDSLTAKQYYRKSIELYDERIDDPEKVKFLFANRLNRAFSLILLGNEKEGKDEMRKLKSENPDNLTINDFLNLNKKEYIKQMIDYE